VKERLCLIFFSLLTACPPSPKPTRVDMAAPAGDMCLSNPTVRTEDVCGGSLSPLYTAQGWACARCEGASQCLTTDFVWCVSDCSDPACASPYTKQHKP